ELPHAAGEPRRGPGMAVGGRRGGGAGGSGGGPRGPRAAGRRRGRRRGGRLRPGCLLARQPGRHGLRRAGLQQRDQQPGKDLFVLQKRFFQSRIAANTLTGSAMRAPRYLLADSTTAGSRQRRKGLVAFSSPSVLGSVG